MGFKKMGISCPEDAWDARQKLVTGWNAEKIREARVLVVGAGAIANETLKNLALLGFGHVIVCDMDRIENSNLTRTVLFTREDVGREKAALAAERALAMNLEPTATADSIDGDIVYELGDGVFRRVDLVLGCLDNAETRMYVNKMCMRYELPYIDAGIGSLGCTVRVMRGHEYGCYACHAADYKYEDRFRQSCDITKKKAAMEGKMATVQTTSAVAAAIQVQEALKIICDMNPEYGVELHYQGLSNLFTKFKIPVDEQCQAHQLEVRSQVRETPLSNQNTLREFLEYAAGQGYDRLSVLEDKLRNFVTGVKCPGCGKIRKIFKPMYQVFSEDFYCEECKSSGNREEKYLNDAQEISLYSYSLKETPTEVLDLKLEALGIPALHILPVWDEPEEQVAYLELTKDLDRVLPEYAGKY